MFKRLSTIFCVLFSVGAIAQNGEYRSASNPFYWKNRKPYEGYWQQDVHYRIKATVSDQTDVVSGELLLTYYNNSPDTLTQLYFHLYQNAFVKGGYLENLNKANHFYQQFGKYESQGKGTEIDMIEITSSVRAPNVVSEDGRMPAVDGVANKYQVTPVIDYSIMRVDLQSGLLPNSSIEVKIRFKTYFDDGGNQRRRMKLFNAYGYKHYDGVHWYPRICVYDRKFGWATDQHLGKEFYGDFGTYEVELSLPNHFVMDATGVLQNPDEVFPGNLRQQLDIKNFEKKPLYETPSVITEPNGTIKTWKFRAINVHDFAWTADPTYRIGEVKLKLKNGHEVSCIALAQEPHASRWQDAAQFAAKVIEVYSNDFGYYAYPKMIVADARDGMEYPMLTLDGGLSPGYYGLFAHEIGHNWFFGMVGNNETYRASLDEGFTQFLTNWCMTRIFGEVKPTKKNPYPFTRMDQTVYWGYLRDAVKWEDMPLNTHSDDFNSALHHGGGYGHVYYKTATMLYNLQYVLGDELFQAAMQHYFNQWKMAHPYFEDFRNSIINFTHVDLNWFFDQWMETTKRIDYEVKDVRQKNDTLHITFKRKGEMQMPIDFTVITKDGKQQNYLIPNTYFAKKTDATVLPVWRGWGLLNPTYTAKIKLDSKFKDVRIDTTYRLADVYQLDNNWRRTVHLQLDKGRRLPPTRRAYIYEWRPELWYNSVDGIKAGLHLESYYMNGRHSNSLTIWYNTQLANDYAGNARNPVDFRLYSRDLLARKLYGYFDLRALDGLEFLHTGIELTHKQYVFDISYKSLLRANTSDLDYLLFPSEWTAQKQNSTLNIDISRNYQYRYGNGSLKYGLRTTLFGDYSYSRVNAQWINSQKVFASALRSRVFVQVMQGTDIAPESRLFLNGANPEEMMDNKFLRSRAFVPVQWLGYGNNYNHFHAAGGLNIRGYAGYLTPRLAENLQLFMYRGSTGLAGNFEWDIDDYIKFTPARISPYLHLDAYLFGDVGLLENEFKAGENGLLKQTTINTGWMASAGSGFALTIKKWGKLDKAKPLTIRVDLPLLLSNTPFVDGQNFKMRWLVGLNRAF
jgi:aminopeptidase N